MALMAVAMPTASTRATHPAAGGGCPLLAIVLLLGLGRWLGLGVPDPLKHVGVHAGVRALILALPPTLRLWPLVLTHRGTSRGHSPAPRTGSECGHTLRRRCFDSPSSRERCCRHR